MTDSKGTRTDIVERLRGIYRVPINDGLGKVDGSLEPDNDKEFVRKFPSTPIQMEAADEIERLRADGLLEYFERQIEWSKSTFGPALRTNGVIDHIRKELREIKQKPHDLSEWVDVVILAMDGFWRHGGKAADLLPALLAKQQKNMARTWPDWRTMSEDSAIEHDRSKDASPLPADNGRAE